MKTMIYMIISVIIFVSFAFWAQYKLENSAISLGQHLNQLELAIKNDNWSLADDQIKDITRVWNKNRNMWQMLIDHEEVDNIDSTLARVKQLVELQEKTDSLAEIAALKLFILHIPEKEALNIVNII